MCTLHIPLSMKNKMQQHSYKTTHEFYSINILYDKDEELRTFSQISLLIDVQMSQMLCYEDVWISSNKYEHVGVLRV